MAFVNADRVRETSTTTGTGTLSLAGAVAGFRTFVAGVGDANTCHYCIEDGSGWEVGIGTVADASPDTLARTTVLASSNAGALVNFAAGTKRVFCCPVAAAPFALWNDLSPAQITADQNDYAPTGFATASLVRLSTDQPRSLTGLAAGTDGQVKILVNVSSAVDGDVVLRSEHTSSAAANRLALGFDVVLEPNEAIALVYDVTSSRWRPSGARRYSGATFRRSPFFAIDFWNVAGTGDSAGGPLLDFTASGTGTQAGIAGEPNHPGIRRVSSSTTTSSGGRISTDVASFRLAGGERLEFVFRIQTTTNLVIRFGFVDSAANTDCVDGAYIEIPSTLAAVGKTANNSTRTTSGTIATLATATWYVGVIKVNRDATAVDFEIYDDAGNLLGSVQNTTNIPTGAGRETGWGFMVVGGSGAAIALADLDYMSIEHTRALV